MKASLIIPCWNAGRTLRRCIDCIRAQTFTDFEAVFVDDGSTDGTAEILADAAAQDCRFKILSQENRGVSAARNRGLDAASGELVFFADPDDTFSPELLSKGVAAMDNDSADYCVFAYRELQDDGSAPRIVTLKDDYCYTSNAEIREGFMSRMFGYSPTHVLSWYAGKPLFAHREQGAVWRCIYRRALIAEHRIRFDEEIHLYEDAMFNCEYMLHARTMNCIREPLYDYVQNAQGAVSRLRRNRHEIENKFALLRRRRAIDEAAGGTLAEWYSASCVFSVLEMVMLALKTDVGFFRGMRLVAEYAAEPEVCRALRSFPLSFRHPVLASAVLLLRNLRWKRRGDCCRMTRLKDGTP